MRWVGLVEDEMVKESEGVKSGKVWSGWEERWEERWEQR